MTNTIDKKIDRKLSNKETILKPDFLKIKPVYSQLWGETRKKIKVQKLHTVCEEAKCPNINECWSSGTATIMILGDVCTRHCKFCSVKTGNPQGIVDEEEPERIAKQVKETGLKYIVITCVDRDDLPDGGAKHFYHTITAIKKLNLDIKVECLVSDYQGNKNHVDIVLAAKPDVYSHNIETVERLTPSVRDPRAGYRQSLATLEYATKAGFITKSSIMLGFGETKEELIQAIKDLKEAGVKIITFGQFLQPSKKHLKVKKYYQLEEFKELKKIASDNGFLYVASGPFVRSSYKAAELFLQKHLEGHLV